MRPTCLLHVKAAVSTCLQMQAPLFWEKVITKTCLITEMSPEPSQMGHRVPVTPQSLALSLAWRLRAWPLVSDRLGSDSDSATDLLCDLGQGR